MTTLLLRTVQRIARARSTAFIPLQPNNQTKRNVATTALLIMPSIYDDSGGDAPLRKKGGMNDDAGDGVDDGGDHRSKVCGIFCDTEPHHDASYAGGGGGGDERIVLR